MKLFEDFKKINLSLVDLADGFDVLEFRTKFLDEDFIRFDVHVF